MPKLRYVGPIDEVDIPLAGCSVKRGETFEVDEKKAAALLEQVGNYEPVDTKATSKKKD